MRTYTVVDNGSEGRGLTFLELIAVTDWKNEEVEILIELSVGYTAWFDDDLLSVTRTE